MGRQSLIVRGLYPSLLVSKQPSYKNFLQRANLGVVMSSAQGAGVPHVSVRGGFGGQQSAESLG